MERWSNGRIVVTWFVMSLVVIAVTATISAFFVFGDRGAKWAYLFGLIGGVFVVFTWYEGYLRHLKSYDDLVQRRLSEKEVRK